MVAEKLREIYDRYKRRISLFYNKNLELNQPLYLTEAPRELVDVFNDIYKKKTGSDLPHVGLSKEPPEPFKQPPYTLQNFVNETGFEIQTIKKWEGRLLRKKHIILQGPPGTGKTYVAERLARLMVSETTGFWEIIQFHPSYSYEDFIQGIKPDVVEGGSIKYDIRPGRFLDFCRRANAINDGSPCVLIIDEINRANLSRVFGELMYLLEYRDNSVPLAYGGKLQIPKNVYLIGTMNTADRSIALVDHAMRRRFSFICLRPKYEVLERYLNQHNLTPEPLVDLLKEVNRTINDPHFEVGISFFLVKEGKLQDIIQDIWQGEIEPYLEEYFYDQLKTVKDYRWDAVKERFNEWQT